MFYTFGLKYWCWQILLMCIYMYSHWREFISPLCYEVMIYPVFFVLCCWSMSFMQDTRYWDKSRGELGWVGLGEYTNQHADFSFSASEEKPWALTVGMITYSGASVQLEERSKLQRKYVLERTIGIWWDDAQQCLESVPFKTCLSEVIVLLINRREGGGGGVQRHSYPTCADVGEHTCPYNLVCNKPQDDQQQVLLQRELYMCSRNKLL